MQDQEKDFFEETHAIFTNYVDDRLLLIKIRTAKKSGRLISVLVSILIASFFFFFLSLFLSIMAGFYFAQLVGSNVVGFSIVAGIYAFLLLLFLALRKQIVFKPITNLIIKIFFEKSLNEMELNTQDDE